LEKNILYVIRVLGLNHPDFRVLFLVSYILYKFSAFKYILIN
jgi:hypothetical protein